MAIIQEKCNKNTKFFQSEMTITTSRELFPIGFRRFCEDICNRRQVLFDSVESVRIASMTYASLYDNRNKRRGDGVRDPPGGGGNAHETDEAGDERGVTHYV